MGLTIFTWSLIVLCTASLCAVIFIERFPTAGASRFLTQLAYQKPKSLSDFNHRETLNQTEFAQLEKDLPGLRSVTFVGKSVQEPTPALAHAVLDNFSEGVRYAFFVSKIDNNDDDLSQYRNWFKALFDASVSWRLKNNEARSTLTFSDLFLIARLPGDWQYVPYVFYSFGDGSSERLLALKGTEVGVGISSGYIVVAEAEAQTIIGLVSMSSSAFGTEMEGGIEALVSTIPEGAIRKLQIVTNGQEAA